MDRELYEQPHLLQSSAGYGCSTLIHEVHQESHTVVLHIQTDQLLHRRHKVGYRILNAPESVDIDANLDVTAQ
jgi:hypothetical protein